MTASATASGCRGCSRSVGTRRPHPWLAGLQVLLWLLGLLAHDEPLGFTVEDVGGQPVVRPGAAIDAGYVDIDKRLRCRQRGFGGGFVPGTVERHRLDCQVQARQNLSIALAFRSTQPALAAGCQGVAVLAGAVVVQSLGERPP